MIKTTHQNCKNLTQNFNRRAYFSPFGAETSLPLKVKNIVQTMWAPTKYNFQEVLKTGFLTLKILKITLSVVQTLNINIVFRGDSSSLWTENRLKIGAFKSKNNIITTSEQFFKNFQKVQKTTSLTLKIVNLALSQDKI